MDTAHRYGHSSKNQPPCYQCLDREIGCHSNCEKYNDWRNELRDKKHKIGEQINPKHCHYFKQKYSGMYAHKNSKKKYR